MAVRMDFLQDKNGDLLIRDGDFVIGESDQQHVEDTLISFPGWWKENPLDGVGVQSFLNSSGQEQTLARKIKLELESDGYQVNNPSVKFVNGQLEINPNANRV